MLEALGLRAWAVGGLLEESSTLGWAWDLQIRDVLGPLGLGELEFQLRLVAGLRPLLWFLQCGLHS